MSVCTAQHSIACRLFGTQRTDNKLCHASSHMGCFTHSLANIMQQQHRKPLLSCSADRWPLPVASP